MENTELRRQLERDLSDALLEKRDAEFAFTRLLDPTNPGHSAGSIRITEVDGRIAQLRKEIASLDFE